MFMPNFETRVKALARLLRELRRLITELTALAVAIAGIAYYLGTH